MSAILRGKRSNLFSPFLPWGFYLEKSSLEVSRALYRPIQHFSSAFLDEIAAYLLKGRSVRVGDKYQLYACTEGLVNKPLERMDHVIPKTNIRTNDDINILQMIFFQFVELLMKRGNVYSIDVCVKA